MTEATRPHADQDTVAADGCEDGLRIPPAAETAAAPGPIWPKRFAAERSDSLPIIDEHGSLLGVIAAVDIERAISKATDEPPLAAVLARAAPDLRADDSLEDAVHALGSTDDEGVPVLGEDHQLIGWLTHRRLLRAYRERSDEQRHTPIQP